MTMARLGFFVLLLFSYLDSRTQALSVKQMLKSAWTDPVLDLFDHQAEWLKQGGYQLPWVNTLEFRTRNNELLYNRQQYALRLDVENPLKVIHNRKYFETQQQLTQLRRQRAIKEALTDRYLMIVQLNHHFQLLEIRKLQDSLARQLVEIAQGRIGSTDFDAEDLVDARLAILSRQSELREAEYDFSILGSRIARQNGLVNATFPDLAQLIRIETIEALYDSVRQAVDILDILEKTKQSELASRKIKVEQSSFSMGWVQGMYVPYKLDEGERPTGVALGVTIPLFNKNKDNEARSRINSIQEESELKQLKLATTDQWQERRQSLRLHILHHAQIKNQFEQIQKDGLASVELMNNYDPVVRIKFESELLKYRILIQKIETAIRTEWVLLLDQADMIIQPPARNYLSDQMEILD